MRVMQMNAFGLDGLTLTERAVPEPGPGEVRIRLRAASVNYHDLATVSGFANPRLAVPRVPLSDGAGEVDAVGPGVESLCVGDRVTSLFFPRWSAGRAERKWLSSVTGETVDGVLRDYMVVPWEAVLPAPRHLDFRQAATLPCAALTAWRAVVEEGAVTAGDRVLIQGTGGVSLFALQFAKLLGAETFLISSSDDKLAAVAHLGADHTLNYRDTPEWGPAIRKMTGGAGVDLVVEVGGAGTVGQSLRALRIGGCVAMIGVLTGMASQVETARIMALNARVQGITVGNREQFERMNRAISLHRLQPVIGEVFGFDGLRAGLELMQSGGHRGKICLDFDA